MRYINDKNDLKLYLVTGTQAVLLSFDISKEKILKKKFMGFSIERTDKNGKVTYHNGSKYFASLVHDAAITDPQIKYVSLVQSFFWTDYTADPGETYIYTVKAMCGNALHYETMYESSIEVKTEELHSGKHSVYFNYGVTGSQGYAKNKEFGNKSLDELDGKTLKHALAYLGRELWSEGLVKFVRQVRGGNYRLCSAFYEFQYDGFLKEMKDALDSGADVQIVYSAQPGQKKKNVAAIDKAGFDRSKNFHIRTKANQPHNKFIVLSKDGIPAQVWTGSTNITLAGIFGHCNTGHWIEDASIAAKYQAYWDALKDNPKMSVLAAASENIQADTDLTKLDNGTYVFFSPRDQGTKSKTAPVHLDNYAKLIDKANELVCMIFPFNIDDVFKTVYRKDKKFLRFLIFEKAEQAKNVKSNDKDLKITAGSVLDSSVENWVKEITSKKTAGAGLLYVHNKFFIIDALSSDPIVVTGSANFSDSSITSNDENTILIKGDKRVADIYLTEFNRLFQHFWPRYLRGLNKNKDSEKEGFDKPLDETYTWFNEYFARGKYGLKRKKLFINMKDAKRV